MRNLKTPEEVRREAMQEAAAGIISREAAIDRVRDYEAFYNDHKGEGKQELHQMTIMEWQQAGSWHDPREVLPRNGELCVIIREPGDRITEMARYNANTWHGKEGVFIDEARHTEWLVRSVSYWIGLPEPPERARR